MLIDPKNPPSSPPSRFVGGAESSMMVPPSDHTAHPRTYTYQLPRSARGSFAYLEDVCYLTTQPVHQYLEGEGMLLQTNRLVVSLPKGI